MRPRSSLFAGPMMPAGRARIRDAVASRATHVFCWLAVAVGLAGKKDCDDMGVPSRALEDGGEKRGEQRWTRRCIVTCGKTACVLFETSDKGEASSGGRMLCGHGWRGGEELGVGGSSVKAASTRGNVDGSLSVECFTIRL